MNRLRRIGTVAALTALLALAIVAAFLTRQPRVEVSETRPAGAMDDRLLSTARRITALADTPEELAMAQQALRVADHDFDQAFAIAMREAANAPPPSSGPLKQLAERIADLKERVAADQQFLSDLTRYPHKEEALEVARAQLALSKDELAEAQSDLARQGGDRRANLERIRKSHDDAQRVLTPSRPADRPPTSTLSQQVRAWLTLRDRVTLLRNARQEALIQFAELSRQRFAGAAAAGALDDEAEVDRLLRLSDHKKTLAQIDQRIQDSQQLADVYRRWFPPVEARQRGVVHLMLLSAAGILAVALALVLINSAVRRMLARSADRRRVQQLRVMSRIGAQAVGCVAIALIVFGPPTQLSTIIGLTTAGLTLALKDFIVAFFGWFTLMGKNGIRIGDWVEIEGVGGEVVEIGLLKTVLLEMGNWTNTGHPTGRRVSFVNKFAIERHFFNFSTAGQWLWDELEFALPPSSDAYELAMRIRDRVEQETEEDARLAEKDWERETRQYGTRPFSAKPAVDLRPSVHGLVAVIRYITRAPQRYDVKSRLFQAIVALVHKPRESGAAG